MAPRPSTKADTTAEESTDETAAPAGDTGTEPGTPEPASASTDEQKPTDPQRIVIEQAPAEPAVFYGPEGVQPAPREHVKAVYEPFEW